MGKILSLDRNGVALEMQFGNEAFRWGMDIQFWRNYLPAQIGSFQPGQAVQLYLVKDASGLSVREMGDPATMQWLEDVREEPQMARLIQANRQQMRFEFADGTSFVYDYTDKLKVIWNGEPGSTAELKIGQILFFSPKISVKRIASLASVSNRPIKISSKSEKGEKLLLLTQAMKVSPRPNSTGSEPPAWILETSENSTAKGGSNRLVITAKTKIYFQGRLTNGEEWFGLMAKESKPAFVRIWFHESESGARLADQVWVMRPAS